MELIARNHVSSQEHRSLPELLRPPLSGTTAALVTDVLNKNHVPPSEGLSDVVVQWLAQLPQAKQTAVLEDLLRWQSHIYNPSGALVWTMKRHGYNYTGLTRAIKEDYYGAVENPSV